MFNRPSSNDPAAFVADFIELQCFLLKTPVSSYSLRSLFSMPDDEIKNEGVESSDDFSIETIEDGIRECKQRAESCPLAYPFEVDSNSVTLHTPDDVNKTIYLFLLLYML